MQYISHYQSPIGNIFLAADTIGLIGLWFEGQKYFARCLDKEHRETEIPLFKEVKHWLDIYFSGVNPNFSVPLHFIGFSVKFGPKRRVFNVVDGAVKTVIPAVYGHSRPACSQMGMVIYPVKKFQYTVVL